MPSVSRPARSFPPTKHPLSQPGLEMCPLRPQWGSEPEAPWPAPLVSSCPLQVLEVPRTQLPQGRGPFHSLSIYFLNKKVHSGQYSKGTKTYSTVSQPCPQSRPLRCSRPRLVSASQDPLRRYTSGSVIQEFFTQKSGLLELLHPCFPCDSHSWRWSFLGLPSSFAGFHHVAVPASLHPGLFSAPAVTPAARHILDPMSFHTLVNITKG